MNRKWISSPAKLAMAAAAASAVVTLVSTPAWGKPDSGGRGMGERRVELPASRGRENGGGSTAKSGTGQGLGVQDVRQKTQRGTAAVLNGQHRTFSGPTDRLKKLFSDRAKRVVMGRRR